jgi:hypothetical protein
MSHALSFLPLSEKVLPPYQIPTPQWSKLAELLLLQLTLCLKQNEIRNNSTSDQDWCTLPAYLKVILRRLIIIMTLTKSPISKFRKHTANKQITCRYNDKARIKCHLAASIVIVVNRSVRDSYNSEELAKSIQGDYWAGWLTKTFTLSVFHSKFVHDDRLLTNHVQEQYYPKPCDTSLTMDSSLLVLDLLLRL